MGAAEDARLPTRGPTAITVTHMATDIRRPLLAAVVVRVAPALPVALIARLILAATLVGAHAAPRAVSRAMAQAPGDSAITYDAYFHGVHMAEVRLVPRAGSRDFIVRRKDWRSNRWGSERTVPAAQARGDSSLVLWGAIRAVIPAIPDIERLPFTRADVLGMPDRTTLYERTRELQTGVGSALRRATRWNQRDGVFPMDLVIGEDGHLAAAMDPRGDYVLVRRGDEGFTTVAGWRTAGTSPPVAGVRALDKQMVPMADGVRLATLVYLPSEGSGPFPVIFVRSPYGVSTLINGYWPHVARGYALVVQATRGTSYTDPAARSEGELQLMVHEPADGHASLDWIAAQPWSSGKVCMQGGSYLAYTQWTAAMRGHPSLACLIPEVSMGTAFADQPYVGGGLLVGMAYYQFFMNNRALLPGRTWTDVLAHRPLVELDDYATGRNLPNWDEQVLASTNSAYWKGQDWHHGRIRPELATFQLSGWFDDDLPGTLSNWSLMQRTGTAPQRLLLGPWKHGYNAERVLNGYRYGLESMRDDLMLLKQRWFDAHLKGMANGVTDRRVEYFVLGENRWREASAWPPREVQPQRWYFRGDGHANRLATSGRLTMEPPAGDEPPERYAYDPQDPPTNWMSFDQMLRWEDRQTFQADMTELERRHDVVTFTSSPLEEELTIAGDIMVELHASTDVKDTDWWVHLSDVDEAGRSHRLTLGALRARFRALEDPQYRAAGSNFEREELLSGDPRDVVRYRIGVKGVANTFRKGHRIRIAVMNAMAHYTFPNSNTGGDEARATTSVVGRMAIHHTRVHASHVVLPVLPSGSVRDE
jgi:putative CocE/NonD family hydrolase